MAKLWGARFKGKSDSLADAFSFSISYDYRLALYDVIGSIAHAQMLGKCKIISPTEAKKIVTGLKTIGREIEKETFKFDPKAEDIHTNIQTALKKKIGTAADKLHTARSRNDLIVLDMKLYCFFELSTVVDLLSGLQKALVNCAQKHKTVIIPAYTHLQSAQVVLLAHHLLAYVEMIERDKTRLLDALARMDSNPLGSCALSGSSLPTDRNFVSNLLGFAQTAPNSIDAVSDRDFLAESVAALAITGMHFSRICEDLIVWVTSEFNFIQIDSSLCTGSSIMPHKKNPDICELIRGETATLYANLNRLLVLLKGLPLTYNRDLQLDKPALFESVEKVQLMTKLLTKLFSTLTVNAETLTQRTQDEYFFTVDVMEYLIKKGVSYRDAHDTVGVMTKKCLDSGKKISQLNVKELKRFHPKFEADVKKLLNPETSVKIKKSIGSTNPGMVSKQIQSWKKKLKNA